MSKATQTAVAELGLQTVPATVLSIRHVLFLFLNLKNFL